MMLRQLPRLFHTVRHLRAQQIYGQIRRRWDAASGRLSWRVADASLPFPGCRWSYPKDAMPPTTEGNSAEAIKQGAFQFLRDSEQIGFPPCWDQVERPLLWQYNLHYFDWLWTLDFDFGRRVALDWIAKYPNENGHAGWDPYPTSLRLMNWCGFFFGRFRDRTEEEPDFCRLLWRSLFTQSAWLNGHIETHLLNNHYLENAAALVFVGCCFQGRHADVWFERGMRILSRQIREQILPDGMHFELSPMYHCRVLYVLTALMDAGGDRLVGLLSDPVARMTSALEKVCHPDGLIALLSDSAQEVCHKPEQLLSSIRGRWPSLCARGGKTGCFALPDAGYYGWRGSDGVYMIADFGKIGPDHVPGHGHADMFSFELSVDGHRVIVDSGVHDYEPSPLRQYSRSTAAHNTVEIDGCDQCELWGAFRVARRGRPHDVAWRPADNGFALSGWHDGYRRLKGKPVHAREMEWRRDRGLTIRDRIMSHEAVHAVSRLHLHSACRIEDAGGRSVRVVYPGGSLRIEAGSDIEIQETSYFEQFYDARPRSCLCIAGQGYCIESQYQISVEKRVCPG